MSRRKSNNLIEEIRQFRKNKIFLGMGLIAIGLLGFILPAIPGMVVLGLGVWLLFPRKVDQWLDKIRSFF